MSNTLELCGVGLAALMLAMGPASAVSLNIGGDGGLVRVSPSSPSSPSGGVSVDIGGDDGDLLDGRLIDLDGGADTNAVVDVDLGTNGNGLVDLDTDSDTDGVILDLFGADGTVADAKIGLGGEDGLIGGDDASIVLDLFGPSGTGETVAAVDVGLGGGSTGGDPAVTLDLFGDGASDDVDDTATGSTTSPGAGGPDGTDGTDGTDVAPAGPGTGVMQPIPVRPGNAVRVATATTGSVGCFSPDQGQIAHLLARNSYSPEVTAQWDGAEKVRLVPINLCDDARGRLDAALALDANIGILQSAVAADAEISAALNPGYQPDDVLAVDQSGSDLTVYVY